MKGIYKLCINGKCYIGRDSYIHKDARKITHLSYLNRNMHYNNEMQKDFNNFGIEKVTYEVLTSSENFTSEHLDELERFYIKKLGTFNSQKGYNKTKGGIGMLGYRQSPETLKVKSELVSGENNPQSKLTNNDFYLIVEMLKNGKSNKYIAEKFKIHDRYVSLIRHKKRFKYLWEGVDGYYPVNSDDIERSVSYENFKEIVSMIDEGATNAEITRTYKLSGGTASRIRHRKLYKTYWNRYDAEKGRSTTSRKA